MYVNMYASFLRMINLDKHFFEAALCMYVCTYISSSLSAYVTIGSKTYIFLGTPFFV